ncbi:MAG TPA: hypothetical protein VLH09_05925 [Bryobacteraceae bacterium]|nr:hypothetical protein [Bryobacteraceae bacterium]
MPARLQVAGGGGAEISFTFTRPEALQVVAHWNGAGPGEIFQEFHGQGGSVTTASGNRRSTSPPAAMGSTSRAAGLR